MSKKPNHLKLTWADVEQWVNKGLMTPNQAYQIQRYVEAVGPVAEQAQAGPEQRKGLNLVTIAYYFGGFLILLAYTIFMGLQWQSLGYAAQSMVSLGTIGILWTMGYLLRRAGFVRAGGLLIFAGTGIVPLLVYTVEQMIGVWPDARSYAYQDFYYRIAPAWIFMEVASILVATVVIRQIGFPLLALLIAFWSWFLSMDLTRWITQREIWTWEFQEQIVSILLAVAMLALGVFLQRRTRQDYSLWFYTFGHLIILTHLPPLVLGKGMVLGLLYLATYLTFVVASVWLQRRVFLTFGAIGCYGYVSFLAFDVFEGSLGFVLTLASIGLLIILTTVGYQKYVQPWLEQRLAHHFEIESTRHSFDSM